MNLSIEIIIDRNHRVLTPSGIIDFIKNNSDLLENILNNIKKEKDAEKLKRGKKN